MTTTVIQTDRDNVSVYSGIKPIPIKAVHWAAAIENIRSGKYEDAVKRIQVIKEKDADEYRTEKTKLPAVTFGGIFNGTRSRKNVQSPTGFLVADIDHIPDTDKVLSDIIQDENTWFAFISPGGDGIKCGFRSDSISSDQDHKQFFAAAEKYFKLVYDIEIDPACKDISRLTFMSHDPGAYLNNNAQYFDYSEFELPQPPPTAPPVTPLNDHRKQKYGEKVLSTACQKIQNSISGEQHQARIEQATLVGGFIATGYIDREHALSTLENAVRGSGAKDMHACMQDITDGIAYGEAKPLDPFNDGQPPHKEAATPPTPPTTETTETIKPFTPDHTRVCGVLTEKPPDPVYIVKHNGRGLITAGIVGQLAAAGGTGKSRLLVQLAICCAAKKPFAYFSVDEPLKVLLLNAEDTQDQLDLILWNACGGDFPAGLYARSVKGIIGPLMRSDSGTVVRTVWWKWLDETICNHVQTDGLDLVFLDPKSRLYGLDENDNDHNVQWVACLEALTVKHGVSIIFTHHVPKNTDKISQWMGRGGGALTDACRTNMGMVGLSAKEAEKYQIDDWRNYIKLAVSKTNIGPKGNGDVCLKFDGDGVLHPVNLRNERIHALKGPFLDILSKDPVRYSRRELRREKCTKHIIDEMTDLFPSFIRSHDLNPIVDALLTDASLIEVDQNSGGSGKPKKVLELWSE